MQQSLPVERLSAGELIELNRQLHDLYERGWIKRSTAGHTEAVLFVRKPDGSWRLCYDYRGHNAITEPLVEPLPHIYILLEQTRWCAFFSKIDLPTTRSDNGSQNCGRPASGRSWDSSSGRWCHLADRACPRSSCA